MMRRVISERARRKNLIYQMYPSAHGDFRRMTEVVEKYVWKLGPDYIWVCPIFKSPWVDGGYDVADYYEVNERFGTMEDFDGFVGACRRKGIGVLLDLPLNHTSTEHKWFKRSAEWKKLHFYYLPEMHRPKHYYLWTKRPVNWQSLFGGSACEFDADRGEYYVHLFDKTQADLNWRNPHVLEEFEQIVEFWTKKHGVAGFRLDMCNVLVKSEPNRTWMQSWQKVLDFEPELKNDWTPIFKGCTKYYQRPETLEVLRELFQGREIFTLGEPAGGVLYSRRKLRELTNVIDVAYNSGQMDVFDSVLAMKDRQPKERYRKWLRYFLKWASEPTHVVMLENHDVPRATSRFMADPGALAILQFATPSNSVCVYQGQELGTRNPKLPSKIEFFEDVESRRRYERLRNKGMSDEEAMEIVKHFSRDNARGRVNWSGYDGEWKTPLATYAEMIKLWRTHPALANPNGANRVRNLHFEDGGRTVYYEVGSLEVKVDLAGWTESYVKEDGRTLVAN